MKLTEYKAWRLILSIVFLYFLFSLLAINCSMFKFQLFLTKFKDMQKIMRVANFILFFYLFFNSILFSQSKSIDNTESYLPLLVNKNIALVVNQNSVIGDIHLVDTLKNLGINIISIFSRTWI